MSAAYPTSSSASSSAEMDWLLSRFWMVGVAVDALHEVARLALHEEAERQVEEVVQEPRHEGEVEDVPEPLHHEAPHER